ncbi:hypothetical protein ACWDA3_06370 [Nonomuraea rubra]
MAERTVDIRDPSRRPTAGAVNASREEIQQWLDGTSPLEVHDRGMTYGRVADAIKAVSDALPDIGVALNDAWRSEAAAKTQRALQLLHASGAALADAMTQMSDALTLYGRDYLPTAIEEVRAGANQRSDAEPQPSPGPAPTASAEPTTEPVIDPSSSPSAQPTPSATPQASELDDEAARRAMEKLDRHIVDLYDFKIPDSVTIDLPTVTPVTDDGGRDLPPMDQDRPYTFGDSRNSGGSSGGSSGWGGSTGSSGSNGSSGSSSDSGDRPGAGTPGSSDGPGSSDSPGSSGDGPGSSSDTPGSPSGSPGTPGDQGSPAPGSQSDGTDGTTPSVIDSSTTDPERTTQAGPGTQDPRATETAATPPTSTTPTATTYTPVTTPQTGYPTPTGSAAPAVIGGPGSYTQPGVPGAAAAARAGAGGMGYPFMPMGGGAPPGEHEQQENTTNLTGERDDWHSATESTISPVIRN